MIDQVRRQLMSTLPLAFGFTRTESQGGKTEAEMLVRYLAFDRADRLLAEQAKDLSAEITKSGEEIATLEARLRTIPETRANRERVLADQSLSADGVKYVRDEITSLEQEEVNLRARLPRLAAQQTENNDRLARLRQQREKLASALAEIERAFNIKLPE